MFKKGAFPSHKEARETTIRYRRHAAGYGAEARTDHVLAVIVYSD
ncbi:hypothetical protein ACMDCR_17095 [Labrys okinawensis]